ncbi:helix-turn-helix domain-containing protein [Bianquea renquensis]|uniref:Helix-turn-helix transcriptional regulator n=1 Tax=Bianquea renquensis TaxID=2763661 RepID=A0A926I355_9FIRM|nr:helix-turn-helix transcriptional regulator [Bianquea renquensis]MBC8545000.1 helix-turn-helix transcriptional regulator [Bianquea renquensis]
MNVTYKKLWKLLIDKQITAADIRRATELSSCTMSKLRHDEPVSITVLLKVAAVLDCDISDMCEFEKSSVDR